MIASQKRIRAAALLTFGPKSIGRTQVSRQSDKLIITMENTLALYVAIWAARGRFSPFEMIDLRSAFMRNATKQYSLGAKRPLTLQDTANITTIADTAMAAFVAGLQKNPTILTPIIAGLTAATIGIYALNRGTIQQAKQVVFRSRRDGKVCPICESYDGILYDVEDGKVIDGPSIPVHPNCRCRYLLVSS